MARIDPGDGTKSAAAALAPPASSSIYGSAGLPQMPVFPWEAGNGTTTPQAPAATPDSWLTNPGYLQALAAEQTGAQQSDAQLRAAQEQAIIGYGDPTLASALGVALDPNVAAAARQNYLSGNSTLSRIDKQRDQGQQTNIQNEVSRGLLFSGDTGYHAGQIDQQYGNNVYDAQQALLSQNQQWLGQNLSAKQQLRSATVDALSGAYNTFVSNPALYGAAGATPPAAATPPSAPAATPATPTTAAALAQKPLATAGSRLAGKQQNPYAVARRFG